MDAFELTLLNDYQRDFPLCARPYHSIAQRMGASEARIIDTRACSVPAR
jgi:DNA-binding Lrp family transcriptional regulator